MTKNVLTPVRLGALVGFLSLCAVYLIAQNCTGNLDEACYDLMTSKCNREASNAAEGGYDVAYDACVADWYANSAIRCPTPCATSGSRKEQQSGKRARPVRKQQ